MSIKTKEKTSFHHLGLRISESLQNRIDAAFSRAKDAQSDLKKAELVRDAIERGLNDIEEQLEAAK